MTRNALFASLLLSLVSIGNSGGVMAALPSVESRSLEPTRLSMKQRVARLEQLLDSQVILELNQQVESLQVEVQSLRGLVEVQEYEIKRLTDIQQALSLNAASPESMQHATAAEKVQQKSAQSKKSSVSFIQPKVALPKVETQSLSLPQSTRAAPDAKSKAASSNLVGSEQKTYQMAYSLVQSRDYHAAVKALDDFLVQYPKGEYAPNAHYWLGEMHLVEGRADQAGVAFKQVLTNFPGHQKASDALLKLGYVSYAKGQWQEAYDTLTDVKARYPGSTSARLAESRLKKMRDEGILKSN